MELNLTGRKVLITGASQGIGEGLAQAFAAEGCDLYLVARSPDKLTRIATELSARHGVAVATLPIDITAPDAVERIVAFAGNADVLVNNAGNIPSGNLASVTDDMWRRGWDLKVFGYINLTRAVYQCMKERGGGVIVNIIGAAGEMPDANYIAGSAGNAALMAFTHSLGGRSLDDKIRVLGVNPGPVNTDRIKNMLKHRAEREFGDASRYQEFLATFPRGRAAEVAEVADLVVFLASDRSSYTSGAVFSVDGGLKARR